MSDREVMPGLPTSGQIIGALVTKLGLRHIALPPRTARRYFSADPEQLVRESTREELIGAIAEMLADAGFAAAPQAGEDSHRSASPLASMLRWHADHWDRLRSFLRRRTMYVLPSNLPQVWAAYVRLAVIDLALRVAACLHLAGASPAALDFLASTGRSARGDYLNQKREQAGLTLEKLARKVVVHNHTVDDWMYHGARPTNDNLARIAKVLADKIEGSTTSGIALELRALYWISDVAGLLAEHIGANAVDEAIGRLHRYAATTYRTIEQQFPTEERAADLTVLANLGVGADLASPLLATLIEHEPDDEWREGLRSTGMDWVRRVLAVNYQVYLAEVDDLIQQTAGRLFEDWDVSNPEAYAHYRRAQELQMQGRRGEALVEVEQAAQLDPLDPANHFTLGAVKASIGIGRGNTSLVSEGLDALWLAVTLDPQWIVPWTEIGLTLLHTGRPEEAVTHLRNVKPECGPLDCRYYSVLGAAYWKLKRLAQALEAFEAALEQDPEDTAALVAAAESALLLGDGDKHRRYRRRAHHFGADAETDKLLELLREFRQNDQENTDIASHDRKIAVMDAVIRLNPDDDDAHLTRGVAHYAKGRDDLAIADADVVMRLNPDQAAAYMLRGLAFGDRKEWGRMVADMTELIRLRPDDAKAYFHRGLAYGEQDLFDQALADLCEAIRLDPAHAEAYRVRGDCHRYKGEYDQAIADFDTALQLDPENAAAHLGRGAAYRMKGDADRAITDYTATLRLRPRDALAFRFRGDAHIAKGNYDQAISDCSKALKLSPNDSIAHYMRGNAHLFSGALKLARADFNAAVELDPTSRRFTFGRGLVRELMGDAEGSAADYRRARDLGYDHRDLECDG